MSLQNFIKVPHNMHENILKYLFIQHIISDCLIVKFEMLNFM